MSKQQAKINMIKQQLRTGDVLDESILKLYDTLLRDEFVPEFYQSFAYSDMQIPLDSHNRMMTPLEEGKMLQTLAIQPFETILEIGTGTGFVTALLSKLAKKVITLDINAERQNKAKQKLQAHDRNNIEFIIADGTNGYMEKAPYDVIVFTGALNSLSESVKLQLLPNGRIFTITGQSPAMQGLIYELNEAGLWHKSLVFETVLPLLKSHASKQEFVF